MDGCFTGLTEVFGVPWLNDLEFLRQLPNINCIQENHIFIPDIQYVDARVQQELQVEQNLLYYY
jgi:hypothetical protein